MFGLSNDGGCFGDHVVVLRNVTRSGVVVVRRVVVGGTVTITTGVGAGVVGGCVGVRIVCLLTMRPFNLFGGLELSHISLPPSPNTPFDS